MKKILAMGAMILGGLSSRNASASAGSECTMQDGAGRTLGATLAGPIIFNSSGGAAQVSCPLPIHTYLTSGVKIYYNMVGIRTDNSSAYCDLCVTTQSAGVSCTQLTNVQSYPTLGLYDYYMATGSEIYTYGGAVVRCWVGNGQGVWGFHYPIY